MKNNPPCTTKSPASVPSLGAHALRYELTRESLQSRNLVQRTRKPEVGRNTEKLKDTVCVRAQREKQ